MLDFYLGRMWSDLFQVAIAAIFVANQIPPQHWVTAAGTLALHRKQVGRVWRQEMFS